jgi:hypothetical protein
MITQESIRHNETFEFHRKLLDAFTDQKFLLERGDRPDSNVHQNNTHEILSLAELENLILIKRFMVGYRELLEYSN